MKTQRILITGANGQLGTALTVALRNKFGNDAVITSDITVIYKYRHYHELLDATDYSALKHVVGKYGITQIYHLAAVLSAKGENNPVGTWDVNMKSLLNVLEIASKYKLDKVFFPSSIAVYGADAQKWRTPQHAPLNPSTVYGISKVSGENWAKYYFLKRGVDVRSLRFPGIIGHESLPGGGTTDYAVAIYHKAINLEKFVCYLEEGSPLPMIYMEDAIRATLMLMDAPKANIGIRTSYNIQATSFTPKEITKSIQKFFPKFEITYQPDYRQKIAESWPCSLNDIDARKDWFWRPKFQLDDITAKMLTHLTINRENKNKLICTTV